ncbi:MAG: histone deacetylase family protein, partial [Sphingorhabdus sp.]|nr:histone deacetylase family protein [Sphingorhabdus sp.]
MRLFFDPRQLDHAPVQELHNGAFVPYAETPARAQALCAGVSATESPTDHGEAPVLAVHDAGYIAYLKTAHDRWLAAGRSGDVMGYIWPVVRRRAL